MGLTLHDTFVTFKRLKSHESVMKGPHAEVARGDRLDSVEGTYTKSPDPIPVSKKRGEGALAR